MRTDTWIRRFLGLARHISTWSKDPGTKVGAVIVDDKNVVISMGWNGLPRNMKDTPSRLADRQFKLRHTIHAELNAILNASRSGIALEGASIFVWGLPTCPDCAKSIAQAGITTVYMCCPVEKLEWAEAYAHSQLVYKEVGVATQTHSVDWLEDS